MQQTFETCSRLNFFVLPEWSGVGWQAGLQVRRTTRQSSYPVVSLATTADRGSLAAVYIVHCYLWTSMSRTLLVAIEMLRHVGVDCGVIWLADIASLAASRELEDSLSAGSRGR